MGRYAEDTSPYMDVTETCSCGASTRVRCDYSASPYLSGKIREWRAAHTLCKEDLMMDSRGPTIFEPRLASVADTMRMVQADCDTDAAALDGKPFTAKVAAEVIGETLAMVKACARAIEVLAEEMRR